VEENKNTTELEKLTDDEFISKTVFFHAINSGIDREKALALAKKTGKARYNSFPQKVKRWLIKWCIERIKATIAGLTVIITAVAATAGDKILNFLQSLI
jgi:hypothetical protein